MPTTSSASPSIVTRRPTMDGSAVIQRSPQIFRQASRDRSCPGALLIASNRRPRTGRTPPSRSKRPGDTRAIPRVTTVPFGFDERGVRTRRLRRRQMPDSRATRAAPQGATVKRPPRSASHVDECELVGRAKRNRPQNERVEQREHRGGHADGEGEREHSDRRESRRTAKASDGESHVLQPAFERRRRARRRASVPSGCVGLPN